VQHAQMEKAYALLRRCMELEFAAVEIRLYLDTHPFDQRAQCDFKRVTYQCMLLKPQVEQYFGPLENFSFSQENPSRWVEELWPWELVY